jgi:hypothetical protein
MPHTFAGRRAGKPELRWVLAAVVCGTAAMARAQSPGTAPAATTWSSPWGGTLVPDGMPQQPRQPIVQPTRPAPGGLIQATPSFGTASGLRRAEPIAATPNPMTNVEPLYLDTLLPPAPPEIRVAGLAEDTVAPMNQVLAEPQPPLPPGARDGVFQKIYFTGTWLPALSNEPDSLGIGDLETGIVLGFPFLRRDTPLLVTPQFGTHLLDNAGPLDIPTTLYDAAVEFRHLRKFGAGPWAMDAAVNVGYYSDFDQGSGDALRITGRGIAVYERTPGTKWLLGVAYLNRAGATVMPVFGVIRDGNPDFRLEAIFPRPRALWRTAGSVAGDERWVYVGGEFGGGVWSITRPSTGELDLLSYSDWRVLVGYERKITGGLSRRVELGYVFQRKLEFNDADSEVALDDTLFLRGGLTY